MDAGITERGPTLRAYSGRRRHTASPLSQDLARTRSLLLDGVADSRKTIDKLACLRRHHNALCVTDDGARPSPTCLLTDDDVDASVAGAPPRGPWAHGPAASPAYRRPLLTDEDTDVWTLSLRAPRRGVACSPITGHVHQLGRVLTNHDRAHRRPRVLVRRTHRLCEEAQVALQGYRRRRTLTDDDARSPTTMHVHRWRVQAHRRRRSLTGDSNLSSTT